MLALSETAHAHANKAVTILIVLLKSPLQTLCTEQFRKRLLTFAFVKNLCLKSSAAVGLSIKTDVEKTVKNAPFQHNHLPGCCSLL